MEQYEIIAVGEMAMDFLQEGLLILYGADAPKELTEIAVQHSARAIPCAIKRGDAITIADRHYTVTAVGEEALRTLAQLGHCTLSFYGRAEVRLPGVIELEGEAPEHIAVGDRLVIEGEACTD